MYTRAFAAKLKMDSIRKCFAYIGLHTFGMKLLYPGTCWCMPKILGLNERRMELFQEYGCESRKIKTKDKNLIDTIFLDHRHQGPNGDTLIICCEGSASFYEDGCLVKVPMEAGYSVIGWNHPGFANSTGKPMPQQEKNAMDAVVNYAVHKLHFKRKKIIFYGWSIGSYTASYAAMSNPSCQGIILDATFDRITDLAKVHMPKWLESIVDVAINNYADLNVAEQLLQYNGPILIIRRTRDEVTSTDEFDLLSNRGNNLLIVLFQHRYPNLMTDKVLEILNKYLALTGNLQKNCVKRYNLDPFECALAMQTYVAEHSLDYPIKLGKDLTERQKIKMVLFLASKYMVDYDAPHCRPLPLEMFQQPWNPRIHP